MAQSKRKIIAAAWLASKLQQRDRILGHRSARIGSRPSAAAIAALRAWYDWSDDQSDQALASLVAPIPVSADDHAPWWIHVLTSDPCFLSRSELARCECIMALPSTEGLLPDWGHIVELALDIYHRKAKSAASNSTLHLYSSTYSTTDYSEDVFCDGRGLRLMPAYSCDDLFNNLRQEKFNRRRIKRRAGKSVPDTFYATFYGFAEDLWRGGLSLHSSCIKAFDDWHGVNSALIEALLACGASFATRSPGFFAKHPHALSPTDNDIMAQIDAQRLDEPRARRALESHSSLPLHQHKRTSL